MIRIAICDDEKYMSDHIRIMASDFFRYLINLKHLKGYRNGTAYMDNGREVPVSRLRGKEFSSVVLQYMKN